MAYNFRAVQKAIDNSGQFGKKISKRESKAIHALLKGHDKVTIPKYVQEASIKAKKDYKNLQKAKKDFIEFSKNIEKYDSSNAKDRRIVRNAKKNINSASLRHEKSNKKYQEAYARWQGLTQRNLDRNR